MATYSVVTSDGQWYGPADEIGLAEWIRQGRVDGQTVLHCHETNARVSAGAVPALQPMLGLSPQQVAHLLHPQPGVPVFSQSPSVGYAAPAVPIGYAGPGGYVTGPAEHTLSPFPVAGAVLLSLFVPFFAVIFYGLAHGNLPRRRPDDPSAGKAIGFMFIPLFNIYWICFFWPRLCTRINEERARAGLAPTAPRSLVIAILWSYLGLLIPIIGLLVIPAILVMLIIAVVQLQGSINELCAATGRR